MAKVKEQVHLFQPVLPVLLMEKAHTIVVTSKGKGEGKDEGIQVQRLTITGSDDGNKETVEKRVIVHQMDQVMVMKNELPLIQTPIPRMERQLQILHVNIIPDDVYIVIDGKEGK